MKEVYRVQSLSDNYDPEHTANLCSVWENLKVVSRDLHRWLTKNNDSEISKILRYSSQNQNTR